MRTFAIALAIAFGFAASSLAAPPPAAQKGKPAQKKPAPKKEVAGGPSGKAQDDAAARSEKALEAAFQNQFKKADKKKQAQLKADHEAFKKKVQADCEKEGEIEMGPARLAVVGECLLGKFDERTKQLKQSK